MKVFFSCYHSTRRPLIVGLAFAGFLFTQACQPDPEILTPGNTSVEQNTTLEQSDDLQSGEFTATHYYADGSQAVIPALPVEEALPGFDLSSIPWKGGTSAGRTNDPNGTFAGECCVVRNVAPFPPSIPIDGITFNLGEFDAGIVLGNRVRYHYLFILREPETGLIVSSSFIPDEHVGDDCEALLSSSITYKLNSIFIGNTLQAQIVRQFRYNSFQTPGVVVETCSITNFNVVPANC
ncbi:MAG: hypothetical protein ACFB10_14015 [Salibacteraceae bacterium]